MSFLQSLDTTTVPSLPPDYDATSAHIVAAVVSTLYKESVVSTLHKELLSCAWTADRYYTFLDVVETAIITARNKDIRIIINSLNYIKKYLLKLKEHGNSSSNTNENSIFLTAFKLSQKFYDDYYLSRFDIDLSIFTNMDSRQLKQFEFKFLETIEYNLNTTPEQYLSWESECFTLFTMFIAPAMPSTNYAAYNHNPSLLLSYEQQQQQVDPLSLLALLPEEEEEQLNYNNSALDYYSYNQQRQEQRNQSGVEQQNQSGVDYCDDITVVDASASSSPSSAITANNDNEDYFTFINYDYNETTTTATGTTNVKLHYDDQSSSLTA